jgi:hypothetical protein
MLTEARQCGRRLANRYVGKLAQSGYSVTNDTVSVSDLIRPYMLEGDADWQTVVVGHSAQNPQKPVG